MRSMLALILLTLSSTSFALNCNSFWKELANKPEAICNEATPANYSGDSTFRFFDMLSGGPTAAARVEALENAALALQASISSYIDLNEKLGTFLTKYLAY